MVYGGLLGNHREKNPSFNTLLRASQGAYRLSRDKSLVPLFCSAPRFFQSLAAACKLRHSTASLLTASLS